MSRLQITMTMMEMTTGREVDGFYKMKVCFQTSLGLFLSVFLLSPKSRGAQGERLVPGVL